MRCGVEGRRAGLGGEAGDGEDAMPEWTVRKE